MPAMRYLQELQKIQERDRILEFLSRPSGQGLFRIHDARGRHTVFVIVPNPGGFIELDIPEEFIIKSSWTLVVNSFLVDDDPDSRNLVQFDLENMTHAFMACVFIFTKGIGMEMPPEVIQFDPEFYEKIPSLEPSLSGLRVNTLSAAAQFLNIREKLLKCSDMNNSAVHLNIVPDPGGYVRIISKPILPFGTTCCILVVHGSSPRYNQFYYRVQVANVRQAFVACLFLLTMRLGMEMPPDLIQFDPQFYKQLPARILSALNSPSVPLNLVASMVDDNLWSFYY